jgi:DNA-binding beta-propeller fold protein YncE
VSVLDATSGTVRRTITVGTYPVAVAVGAGTGRVFVVNREDNTVSVLAARG